MSVYLLEWCGTGPNTRARCSGSGRAVRASWSTRSRRMRSMLTHVAHQGPSHPVTLGFTRGDRSSARARSLHGN